MNDLKRLLDEGATDAERDLLGSWQSEAPSPGARKALIGLAVGAGLGTASSAAGASAPKATAAVGAWAFGKWILVGAVSGLAAITTVNVALPPSAPAPNEARAPKSPSTDSKTGFASDPLGSKTGAASDSDPLKPSPGGGGSEEAKPASNQPPSRETGAASAARTTPVSSSSLPSRSANADPAPSGSSAEARADTRPRSTLSDEVERVTEARALVRTGQSSAALGVIDAYQKLYPAGAFVSEVAMLRITSLVALGRRVEAVKIARPFKASPANAIYLARLRAMLPELDNE